MLISVLMDAVNHGFIRSFADHSPQHKVQEVKVEMVHGITLKEDREIRKVLVATQDVRQIRRTFVAPGST